MIPNYQRFIDLIRVVEKVPPEKFDMAEYFPFISTCGCAMHHFDERRYTQIDAPPAGSYAEWVSFFGLQTIGQSKRIFGGHDYYFCSQGNPAKLELLRRIREVLGLPKRPALEMKQGGDV